MLGFDGEIEVTSWRGSVREACLWSPGLAGAGGAPPGQRSWTATSRSPMPSPTTARCGPRGAGSSTPTARWCGPGLVRHYAARHGLWQLDPDIAYLSGDELPDGVRGFEVLEAAGLQREAPAAGACRPSTAGRWKSWSAACGRAGRPRRAAAPAAAARAAGPVGRDHPDRVRGSGSGDGFRLPSVTLSGPVSCRLRGHSCLLRQVETKRDEPTMRILVAARAVAGSWLGLAGWPPAQRDLALCRPGRLARVRAAVPRARLDRQLHAGHDVPGRLSRPADPDRLPDAEPRRLRQRRQVARRRVTCPTKWTPPPSSTVPARRPRAPRAWCSKFFQDLGGPAPSTWYKAFNYDLATKQADHLRHAVRARQPSRWTRSSRSCSATWNARPGCRRS